MSEDMSEEPNSAETPREEEAQSLSEEDAAGSEAQSEVQDGTEGVTSVTEESDDSAIDRLSRPPQEPSIFTLAKKEVSDPCWYCMMSLIREDLNLTQPHLEELESDASTAPPAAKTPNYQTDPRPHFGIPNSSRSTPFPLWGIRGPRERRKGDEEEEGEEVCMCPHCNLACPADTLRWHEAKCLIFEGLKNLTEQQQSTN